MEDDGIIANLITVMLEKKGYSIVGKIASGEESILRAAEVEPGLILTETNLAGVMDGAIAARFISHFFQFPIVFFIALCDEQLFEHARNEQSHKFILKPFTTDRDLSFNNKLVFYNHTIRKKYLGMYLVGEPKKIKAARDPILITDTRGKIIFYNPYATRFLDLPGGRSRWTTGARS